MVDFNRIFGSTGLKTTLTDAQYNGGLDAFLGTNPPKKADHNSVFEELDLKASFLNDVDVAHAAASDPHPQYLMPVGSLLIMDGNVLPAGFLKRNGVAILRASYPNLWAYAQSVSNFISQATKDGAYETYAGYYGDGDGTTTFTIPDSRGDFPRAWDDGRGVDSGRGIGSHQLDTMQGHYHRPLPADASASFSTNFSVSGLVKHGLGGNGSEGELTTGDAVTDGVNGDPRLHSETKPRNTAMMFCIKY